MRLVCLLGLHAFVQFYSDTATIQANLVAEECRGCGKLKRYSEHPIAMIVDSWIGAIRIFTPLRPLSDVLGRQKGEAWEHQKM